MASFKLKDKNGVETTYTKSGIKIPSASGTGYSTFSEGMAGACTVTLKADDTTYQVLSILQGSSINYLESPVSSGKAFIGWASTQGGTTPNITFPYTPTDDVTLYAVFTTWRCTVSGLGNVVPSTVTFTHEGTMPTFEQVTFNGDTMIKVPTMYRKVVSNPSGQITSYIISTAKEDNDFYPYSCFVKEDGVTVMPYILIGKFMSSSTSAMNSIGTAGQTSGRATQTITNGRTNARARGTGYQLYDWQMQKLWQDLITCKMNTVNINTGSGITTDQLGFEWENSGGWIDGVSCQGSAKQWVISDKPSKYVDSATASTDGYKLAYGFSGTSGYEILALRYNSNNEFFNYPASTTYNTSFNTYYCDYFTFGTSTTHPVGSYVGVGSSLARSGAFSCNADNDWTYPLGVRLCYRPVALRDRPVPPPVGPADN